MTRPFAFAALVTLFQLVTLHLSGVALSLPLLAVAAGLALACQSVGHVLLGWAGHPLRAALPAAFVIGFTVVSVALFGLAAGLGLSPVPGIAGFAMAGVALLLWGGPRLDSERADWADLGWAVAVMAVMTAVALSAIRSPVTLETQGILPIWYDAFLHGLSVQAFAGLEGPPMDPELYGASLIFYHYAPFVPPAALLDVAGINGLTAVAGHLLPLGLLIGALGLYALVVQLAGRAAGVVALALLVIVPDPADYMLLSGWFDMAWLLFGSVGSGYGMGPMFVAAACLHAALGGAEHRRRVLALAVGLALLSILERVQMFMLLAPPLLAVWIWAAGPRWRRGLVIGTALFLLVLTVVLVALPGVRADWLARAKVIEYLEIAVNWSERYATWIAPHLGTGFPARAAQLGLVVLLSLGVFLLAAPVAAAMKLRRAGAEPMDLLPGLTLAMYVFLVLFAPPGFNGDHSEYKHRHMVELYFLFAGFTAAWALRGLPERVSRPLAGAAALAALAVAGLVAGRPIDAPNVAGLPWAGPFHGQPVAKGVPQVAAFLAAEAQPGAVMATDATTAAARLGPMTEVMGLVDLPAYLARGDLKALRSPCHAAVVADRLALLARVAAAPDPTTALGLLAEAGVGYYLALSGLPDWDKAGEKAAFLTDGMAVYITKTPVRDAAFWAMCNRQQE